MSKSKAQGYRILTSVFTLPSIASATGFGHTLLATIALVCSTYSYSYGVVVIRDGFGDGDINNNGTPFEDQTSVDDNGTTVVTFLGDSINTYRALYNEDTMTPFGSPALFPTGPTITEPTVADDPSDTGILWTATGGITGGSTHTPSARPRIIDDSTGVQPETGIGFFNNTSGATETIPALNSGLALGFESAGRSRSVSGFFERDQSYAGGGGNGKQDTIALGPNVDDTVKVSFDFRVWMSAPNFNPNVTSFQGHVPDRGELRFGIYQDADDELGESNLAAGPTIGGQPQARVWGQEGGWFRGDRPFADASGDPGWFVRLPLRDPAAADDVNFGPHPTAENARIVEDTNVNNGIHLEGTAQSSGGDTQVVAQPAEISPGMFDFMNMELQKRYHIEFTLRRFDETGGSTNPNDAGDNIEATITVTNKDNPSETSTLTGFDALDPTMMDLEAGFESEMWDYFSITLAGTTNSDDFDFVMDNFQVEVTGSNAPAIDADADGDIDGADFLALQRTDPSLIPIWKLNYGQGSGSLSAAGVVPEPSSIMLCVCSLLAAGIRRRACS